MKCESCISGVTESGDVCAECDGSGEVKQRRKVALMPRGNSSSNEGEPRPFNILFHASTVATSSDDVIRKLADYFAKCKEAIDKRITVKDSPFTNCTINISDVADLEEEGVQRNYYGVEE